MTCFLSITPLAPWRFSVPAHARAMPLSLFGSVARGEASGNPTSI